MRLIVQKDGEPVSTESIAAAGSARDRFRLSKAQLLADYAAISSKRRGAAESTALRLGSRQFLDILAFEASSGAMDWRELRAALASDGPLTYYSLDPMVMAEIGRVLLLQQTDSADIANGVAALEFAAAELPVNVKSRRFRKLLVEHYILSHEYRRARSLLDTWRDVDREFHKYLRAELDNPFFVQDGGDTESWLRNFNREFVAHGLIPIQLANGDGTAFDRLSTAEPVSEAQFDGPKVSVIVTTFKPEEAELSTSVRSILSQTYSNLEVIVVDDASGPQFQDRITAACAVDDRVKIVRADQNGGTYRARNIGLGLATGDYVTGQDDDDWSHPERISEQVSFLETHPNTVGCRVGSVTCLSDLVRVRLGYKPLGANASSLMMRREVFDRVGGFMNARKAADTELHKRAEAITGLPVVDIEKPLAVVRIEPASLSRTDFRAGWSHPARREFKFSYAHWHENATGESLSLQNGVAPQVCIPRRFRVDQQTYPSHFDVVFAGDWRQYGGPQKSMLEEIRALTSRGFTVGVMQLEAPRFMTKVQKPLTPHVQRLINAGTVTEVLYDDPVEVDLLVLRYPPILQFAPSEPSRLQVQQMFILANQAPSELDGSDIRYLVEDCTRNARLMFCEDILWVPQGAQVRAAIRPYLDDKDLAEYDIPGILEPREWYREHRFRRSALPVVGRHSRDNAMKWPEVANVIEHVYPTSGRFDIRILGGAMVPQAVLGYDVAPAAWTVYETDALPVEMFLETLDFYVFFQHSVAVEAFGRSILEAIASGLVVILPPHYRDVFAEAAVYAKPSSVYGVIMQYHNDRDRYNEQVRRARAVVEERFSHNAYSRLIQKSLNRVRS